MSIIITGKATPCPSPDQEMEGNSSPAQQVESLATESLITPAKTSLLVPSSATKMLVGTPENPQIVAAQKVKKSVQKKEAKEKKEKDPNAPKRALTAMNFYVKAHSKELVAEHPGERIMKIAGEKWKNLSEEEKAPYVAMAEQDKQRAKLELEQYQSTQKVVATPKSSLGQVVSTPIASTSSHVASSSTSSFPQKVKKSKKSDEKKEKDPNAPKRPPTAYLLYCKHVKDEKPADLPSREWQAQVAERWKNLSEVEKQPFQDQYKADKLVYEQAMKDYKEATPVPTSVVASTSTTPSVAITPSSVITPSSATSNTVPVGSIHRPLIRAPSRPTSQASPGASDSTSPRVVVRRRGVNLLGRHQPIVQVQPPTPEIPEALTNPVLAQEIPESLQPAPSHQFLETAPQLETPSGMVPTLSTLGFPEEMDDLFEQM